MYNKTKLKQVPLNVPMLLTFRRRIKKNKPQGLLLVGSYELKLVCCFIEPYHPWWQIWKGHYLIQLIAADPNRPEAWHDRYHPLYLQSVEPFPLADMPLLFTWRKRWDVFETLLKGE